MVTIVSWYTLNTPYKEVLDTYLLPSLTKFELPYKIYPMQASKNWVQNTNLKSLVIGKALEEIKSDILVLDADCKINCYPTLLDEIPIEFDAGFFYLDWNKWYNNGTSKKELCSGTLFFRNRLKIKKLIQDWKELTTKNNGKLVDQRFLELALKLNPDLKIFDLPISYCWISSMPDGSEPKAVRPENVIIEHYQSSRQLRNKV